MASSSFSGVCVCVCGSSIVPESQSASTNILSAKSLRFATVLLALSWLSSISTSVSSFRPLPFNDFSKYMTVSFTRPSTSPSPESFIAIPASSFAENLMGVPLTVLVAYCIDSVTMSRHASQSSSTLCIAFEASSIEGKLDSFPTRITVIINGGRFRLVQ